MASYAYEICNLALARIRKQPVVTATFESAPANEAERRCDLIYPEVRKSTLRDHPWKFAQSHKVMIAWTALVWHSGHAFVAGDFTYDSTTEKHYYCILAKTSADADEPGVGANWETYWEERSPFPQWSFFYALPTGCLHIHRIYSEATAAGKGDDFDRVTSPDGAAAVYVCNTEEAIAECTIDVTDIALWDATAQKLLVLNLAVELAGPLTNDPNVVNEMQRLAAVESGVIKGTNRSESQSVMQQSTRYKDARA